MLTVGGTASPAPERHQEQDRENHREKDREMLARVEEFDDDTDIDIGIESS